MSKTDKVKKSVGGKKSTPKRSTTAKRSVAKKSATKRPAAAKRPVARKPAAKRPAVRKPVVKGAKRAAVRVSAAERAKQKAARRDMRRSYKAVNIQSTGAITSEETAARMEMLVNKMSGLQHAATLASVHDDLADIDAVLAVLPADVEAIRIRGYVFRSFLERKIEVLGEQWADMQERVINDVERRSTQMAREVDQAERAVQAAQGGTSAQVARAESALQTLESKVDAAQDAVEAMFDTLDDNVAQAQTQVEGIEWTLDQVDQCAIDFYPAEDIVAACEAQFMESKKDGPKGVLYLTDERLMFEQKEDVATKKVLFITTEKETVQEGVFAIPVGQIDKVKASQAGLLGGKEMLELEFTREAPIGEARLRLLNADNEEWSGLIGRVQSGEIANERTAPKDEEAVAAAQDVPTKCPTCGAQITVSVVKGMREVNCEYCGAVIRL